MTAVNDDGETVALAETGPVAEPARPGAFVALVVAPGRAVAVMTHRRERCDGAPSERPHE